MVRAIYKMPLWKELIKFKVREIRILRRKGISILNISIFIKRSEDLAENAIKKALVSMQTAEPGRF